MHDSWESLFEARTIRIREGDSESGSRIGGRAPEGVAPRDEKYRYFLTVPISATGLWLSVFSDWGAVLSNRSRLTRGSGVEAVFHGPTSRSTESKPWDSELAPHPLEISDPVPDGQTVDGEVMPISVNKVGGLPYLVNRHEELAADVRKALDTGFCQVIQIGFPSSEDSSIAGPWPFAGLFHVLARPAGSRVGWRWYWEK